jgi:uncharacterized membrane protein
MAKKSGTGLPKNTAAALSVVLAPTVIGTLVFLFLEKDSYVRFYSVQVLVTGVVLVVLQWAFAISVILLPLAGLLTVVGFVVWLLMIYKAWQGTEWELPVLGNISRKLLKKI